MIKSTGGAGMEYHDFAHLDCPLGNIRESGHFVAVKWVDMEETVMELTAFKVFKNLSIQTLARFLRGTRSTLHLGRGIPTTI